MLDPKQEIMTDPTCGADFDFPALFDEVDSEPIPGALDLSLFDGQDGYESHMSSSSNAISKRSKKLDFLQIAYLINEAGSPDHYVDSGIEEEVLSHYNDIVQTAITANDETYINNFHQQDLQLSQHTMLSPNLIQTTPAATEPPFYMTQSEAYPPPGPTVILPQAAGVQPTAYILTPVTTSFAPPTGPPTLIRPVIPQPSNVQPNMKMRPSPGANTHSRLSSSSSSSAPPSKRAKVSSAPTGFTSQQTLFSTSNRAFKTSLNLPSHNPKIQSGISSNGFSSPEGDSSQDEAVYGNVDSETVVKNPVDKIFADECGNLILTEEERCTFDAEGLPVPTSLPLSKNEERNLKRIRRKLKNKWSAQESRRKRKEYMEGLEARCEVVSSENDLLKKRVSDLEHDNKTLLSQLRKLQQLVTSFGETTLKAITPPLALSLPAGLTPPSTSSGNSTVLMMTLVFVSVMFSSYMPYGDELSLLPWTGATSVTSQQIGRSPGGGARFIISPFAPQRVLHDDKSPFTTYQEEIKSRVLHSDAEYPAGSSPPAPIGYDKRPLLSPSCHQGPENLPKPFLMEKVKVPSNAADFSKYREDSESEYFDDLNASLYSDSIYFTKYYDDNIKYQVWVPVVGKIPNASHSSNESDSQTEICPNCIDIYGQNCSYYPVINYGVEATHLF